MATDSSHRVIMGKTVLPLFFSCFSSDPFHTCRYNDMHETSEEFEIRCNRTTHCKIAALKRQKKSPMSYNGKNGVAFFLGCFFDDCILFILVGNNDIHKSLAEFEIQSDLTID